MGQAFSNNTNDSPRPANNNGANGASRRTTPSSTRPGRGAQRPRFDPLSRAAWPRSSVTTAVAATSDSIGSNENGQQAPTSIVTRSMARQSRSRTMPATLPLFRTPSPRRTRTGSPPSFHHPENTSNPHTLAPSLIADVITEAVLSALRERHGNMESAAIAVAHAAAAAAAAVAVAANATPAPSIATTTATTTPNEQRPVTPEEPMQGSMETPPVWVQASPTTGASSEESFFRYLRLPVMFTAMPERGDEEQQREIAMPMFIVGYRVRALTEEQPGSQQQQQQQQVWEEPSASIETEHPRRSQRLAEQRDRQQQQQEGEHRHHHSGASRWVVYILSGMGDGGLSGLSDSPTYEELVALAESIGYARSPISIEQINASAPVQRYTAQVGDGMVGNAERCLVCLEGFQEMEDVRVLKCQHGFHQACIDKWLTEGQNRCPLCREVPVERIPQQQQQQQHE